MRLNVAHYAPCRALVLYRRASPFAAAEKSIQNRPSRRVENIIIKASSKHPALDVKTPETFKDLRLRDDVVEALKSIGAEKPTVVQMLAIPKILRGRNTLCAAETGSGKTLTYLAPLISRLKDEEEHHGVMARLKRPRALIVLPSRDLAAQVLAVTKSLCHVARCRAVGLIGGVKRKYIKDALETPVDIAVATPESLLRYRVEERIHLSDLSHLVLDEADTLFDSSFEEATTSIVKGIKVRDKKPDPPPALGEDAQVTIVGATLSGKMLKKISSLVPNLKKVSSKGLHQILPHIEQRFVKVRQDEKSAKLLELIREHPADVFIVFCNTVPSCDWTAHHLETNGIPAIKLHAGFSPADRKDLLKNFSSGETRVLLCTDIASRGIDLPKVTHVVLFDFPNTIADYLHRVGRTGRVGSIVRCKATAFMTHRRDIQMAWKIKDAAEKKAAIMNRQVMKQLHAMERMTG